MTEEDMSVDISAYEKGLSSNLSTCEVVTYKLLESVGNRQKIQPTCLIDMMGNSRFGLYFIEPN